MTTQFVRDAAMTGAIFGFFAAGWYGWAQDDPPAGWRKPLTVGSIVGLLIAVAGGIIAWQNWSTGTVFDADTSPIFGIIVGIEVVLAVGGALLLSRRGRQELIAPWVALVVGVHFLPMAPLLGYPLFYVVGALVTVAGLVSVPLARSRGITVSAVTGVMCGSILLVAALFSLLA
ncbi:MAG TPA: hypothetical protein VNT92_11365 [Acidimicrobiia bacterium]|nr:hypothetical protein [Acidimicrobiia bacterium]